MITAKPSYDERDLIDRLRAGDKAAFRTIYDGYYAMLLSTSRRFIPDPDICRDLAQEIMAKIWLQRQNLDVRTNLGGYLRRMATNASLDFLEAEKRRRIVPVTEQLNDRISPPDDLESLERSDKLEAVIYQAIDRLPEKCRLVFSMSRFEKMPYRDIAERLGVSQKAVEKHISKALDVLRRAVQDGNLLVAFQALMHLFFR
jgi:RNA polymerase sigma-70 factor (ECF subfamily)